MVYPENGWQLLKTCADVIGSTEAKINKLTNNADPNHIKMHSNWKKIKFKMLNHKTFR